MQLRIPFDPVGSAVWNFAIFIGNLPTLQFTSFSIHTQTVSTGRPVFYFGKIYRAATASTYRSMCSSTMPIPILTCSIFSLRITSACLRAAETQSVYNC